MATVLVVEDDAACRDIVTRRLGRLGCRVLAAETGPTGLALALSARPDLVLLDICLPGFDGVQLLRHLRAHPETADLPVVMVTAQSDRGRVLEAARHRVAGYLVKPFEGRALDAQVTAALRARAREPAAGRPTAFLASGDAELVAAVSAAIAPAANLEVAASGDELLDRVDAVAPCAALVDLGLSGLSAVDVARHLRWFRTRPPLTVALAPPGAAVPPDPARVGLDVVLPTPVAPARLLAEVAAAAGAPLAALLDRLLERRAGWAVLPAPHRRWPALADAADAVVAALGGQPLVVDATHVREPGLALLDLLDALTAAAGPGSAIGLAATAETAAVLAAVRETRRVVAAPTVEAAARALSRDRDRCS